jgi:hypothetical protein
MDILDTNIYIYIYTTSEKPVNDQSYGVLDRYGITILNQYSDFTISKKSF